MSTDSSAFWEAQKAKAAVAVVVPWLLVNDLLSVEKSCDSLLLFLSDVVIAADTAVVQSIDFAPYWPAAKVATAVARRLTLQY